MFGCDYEDDEDLLDGLKTPPENENSMQNIQSVMSTPMFNKAQRDNGYGDEFSQDQRYQYR